MHQEYAATNSSVAEQDLRVVVTEQAKLIEQLRQRIAELEATLSKYNLLPYGTAETMSKVGEGKDGGGCMDGHIVSL